MYSNAKHIAPSAILILILCVYGTNQSLFSRKKTTTTPATATDNAVQQTGPVPQKEVSHWWQLKYRPVESTPSDTSGSNQVAVAVPLIHHKLQTIFDSQVNSDVKWVPCLCPVHKNEFQQLHQPYQYHNHQQQQQQQQQQQPQPQQPQQQYGSSYYPSTTTQDPSEQYTSNNNVPRFILANYPIEA